MKTEFTTYRIKAGMEAIAREWMSVLKKRHAECLETLAREKMHFESIFQVEREGRMYLAWFSVRGEGGDDIRTSPHEIDRIHLDYANRCIDRDFAPEDMQHVISFAPAAVTRAMNAGESAGVPKK